MSRPYTPWHYLAVWPVAALALWLLLVPARLSPSVFAWLNGAVMFMLVFILMLSNGSRRSRTVAELLYDVENEQGRR